MPPPESPVVIVVAPGTLAPLEGDAHPLPDGLEGVDASSALSETLTQALATRMPVMVLARADLVPVATRAVARRDVLVLPEVEGSAGSGAGHAGAASGSTSGVAPGTGAALAAAVSQRADAAGWIVVPAGCAAAGPATLTRIGEALRQHPVAYAQSQGRRMYPVGFASGLLSDLMALAVNDGPRRLAARFPGFAVELDGAAQALAT